MEIHRGRLIDHVHLVVADLAANRAFYGAIFGVLDTPPGMSGDKHFSHDELFVSSPTSSEALGELTGRHHSRPRCH